MSYKTEFPDYDGEFFHPDGWMDNSWHNDTCPHIEKRAKVGNEEVLVYVWQEYADENLRESFKSKRYLFSIEISDGEIIFSYETDDLEKIKELIKHVDL